MKLTMDRETVTAIMRMSMDWRAPKQVGYMYIRNSRSVSAVLYS